MFSQLVFKKGFAYGSGIFFIRCVMWAHLMKQQSHDSLKKVQGVHNHKLKRNVITQPFLLVVVERWHNLVHSDRSRSIGHSSTEKNKQIYTYKCWYRQTVNVTKLFVCVKNMTALWWQRLITYIEYMIFKTNFPYLLSRLLICSLQQ